MVRSEPFISRESVRAVLEGMLYPTGEESSSLEYLTLVDEFLIENNIPFAENQRLFAIRSLVSNLITHQLSSHRYNFGLPPADTGENLEQARHSIQADVRQQSAELVGWSLLYYRYVRVDLNLTPANFSALTHTDERTLRRYQVNSIERLRDALTAQEAQIRSNRKRLHLLTALPNGRPVGMVGRMELVRGVRHLLRDNLPAHLLVTGSTGIGKTSFAHLLLYEQIMADELDKIVWINGAESTTFAEHYVRQSLLPDNSQMDIRDYLAGHRVVVVFDDIQELVEDIVSFQKLIMTLADASIIVIHTIYIALASNFKHILLPELTKDDTFAIAASSRSTWANQEDLEDYVEDLWHITGGNPLAIKLAVNSMNNLNLRQPVGITDDFMRNLAKSVYTALSREARQVLFITALCPPFELSIDALQVVWPVFPLARDCIVELVSGGVLGGDDGQYRLSRWAYRYVRELYGTQPEVRAQIDNLIDVLTHCLMENPVACFAIAEHILKQLWPEMSMTRRLTWIELTCKLGIQRGNYATWAAVLKEQEKQGLPLDLQISQAVCLRKLGDWAAAEDVLRMVIDQTGQEGDFVGQGRGNLELSILLRQQGLYEKASTAAKRALAVFQRFENNDLLYETELELAQIAFDAGNVEEARAFLRHYAPDHVRARSLLGEIHLAFGETGAAHQCVTEAIELSQPDTAVIGRLYALMGKVYFSDGDWMTGERYFSQAVVLLEKHSDQFALARAKTNLAAGMLSMRRDYEDAKRLLLDAHDIQVVIRDRHGLMITQHNLNELDRQVAVDGW
jgi:tetratricopeptide (TPR) repeat protein